MTLTRRMTEEIVVIGAGVVGLTVALHLQELGHKVLIIAKDFPAPFETIDPVLQVNYASPWAGAQNGWGRDLPARDAEEHEWRDHRFALRTFERMERFHDQYADAGVNITRGFEYYERPPAHIAELSSERAEELGIKDFELHPRSQLPKGVKLGYSFRTWTVSPMVYCCFLLRRFTIQGGRIQKRELRSPNEVFARNVKTVVNASGIGFGDARVFVTRGEFIQAVHESALTIGHVGQTCLVANKCDVCISHHHADGTTSFCIPRNFDGGTIIGGTHEPDNWDTAPTPGLRDKLLERIGVTHPPLLEQGKLVPLADIVGRRPTREGGLRLEREKFGGRCVIHAYGAGGRGYELSWGVAEVIGDMLVDQES